MAKVLEITDLTKRFGGLVAVDGVSLSVEEGEIVGLIGPNGAGKTTLFSCIAGLHSPTSGKIEAFGKDITRERSDFICKLGIARTFQVARPIRSMTMLENVVTGALCRTNSVSEARRRAFKALRQVGLEAKAEMLPSSVTTADLRRLEIARAWATEPRMLLLDEAMAGLTAVEADEIVTLLYEIRDSGVTLFLVEHVMDIIASLAERLIVLSSGKKIIEGRPDDVLRDARVIDAYLGDAHSGRSTRAKRKSSAATTSSSGHLSVDM